MNKFPVKLTASDLEQLVDFLNYSLTNATKFGYTKSTLDKLILSGLAELLYKLSSVNNCYKSTYKLQLNVSHGLCLKLHCHKVKIYAFDVDAILINNLIGIVDQKTA